MLSGTQLRHRVKACGCNDRSDSQWRGDRLRRWRGRIYSGCKSGSGVHHRRAERRRDPAQRSAKFVDRLISVFRHDGQTLHDHVAQVLRKLTARRRADRLQRIVHHARDRLNWNFAGHRVIKHPTHSVNVRPRPLCH